MLDGPAGPPDQAGRPVLQVRKGGAIIGIDREFLRIIPYQGWIIAIAQQAGNGRVQIVDLPVRGLRGPFTQLVQRGFRLVAVGLRLHIVRVDVHLYPLFLGGCPAVTNHK